MSTFHSANVFVALLPLLVEIQFLVATVPSQQRCVPFFYVLLFPLRKYVLHVVGLSCGGAVQWCFAVLALHHLSRILVTNCRGGALDGHPFRIIGKLVRMTESTG